MKCLVIFGTDRPRTSRLNRRSEVTNLTSLCRVTSQQSPLPWGSRIRETGASDRDSHRKGSKSRAARSTTSYMRESSVWDTAASTGNSANRRSSTRYNNDGKWTY